MPPQLRPNQVYLAEYLIARLEQVGVLKAFGVPGDFNLELLDFFEPKSKSPSNELSAENLKKLESKSDKIQFIGCCNELNAGYAADGYARISKAKIGCLITTFGVGELSAMNAQAGAYSERVPFVHIVGIPSTKLSKAGALLHHTLGDGKFDAYRSAAEGFSADQAIIDDVTTATADIDRVIRTALITCRPVYIALPTDRVHIPVDASPLDQPLISPARAKVEGIQQVDNAFEEVERVSDASQGEEEMLVFVKDEIVRLWDAAKRPVFLIDACAIRYGVLHHVRELINTTNSLYFTTPMAKSALSESPALGYGGLYAGEASREAVGKLFDEADLFLMIGSLKSDFNTGSFSYHARKKQSIELHSDGTQVQFASYPGVAFQSLLPLLIDSLERKTYLDDPALRARMKKNLETIIPEGDENEMVKQDAFWPMWSSFLQEDDIVVLETGTSSFGFLDTALRKEGITVVSQVLYGSIGWSVGATLGVLLAAQESEKPRRVLLFVGDGSLQLTVQEISTMIRHNLTPIIVVLNNDGYVIERLIHGPTATYNEIAHWNWQALLAFFGDPIPSKTYLAKTRKEFAALLEPDHEFGRARMIQLLEVRMGRLDGPKALIRQAELTAKLNSE